MADTPAPENGSPKTGAEMRRAAYDFCEKTLVRFEGLTSRPKGFQITRSQTITGDTVQRSYVLQFDLRLTGCELPNEV